MTRITTDATEATEPQDDVLAAVARLAGPAPDADPAVAAALADLVAELVAELPREAGTRLATAERRRTRRVAIGVAAAIALTGSAAAGYGGALARTGWFGERGMTENDTSEWIDLSAPDLRGVVDGVVARDLPLPPGVTRADGVAFVSRRGEGLMQVTGLRVQYEWYARCAWMTSYDRATTRGDDAAADRAARTVRDSAAWPATVATDGGGVVDSIRGTAAAAAAGDPAPVRRQLTANCPAGEFEDVR